jgi:hypothetical protein
MALESPTIDYSASNGVYMRYSARSRTAVLLESEFSFTIQRSKVNLLSLDSLHQFWYTTQTGKEKKQSVSAHLF